MPGGPRANQKRRTRRALLQAAARLLKAGRKPTVAEVAEEALVSRATAYRYFPTADALLAEAPMEELVPAPEAVFEGADTADPVLRLDRAESALHEMVYANRNPLRILLARLLDQATLSDVPRRQNRRGPLIEAALAPARGRFERASYERLSAALALVFGTESMVVFNDVIGLSPRKARAVKRWMIEVLTRAALDESAGAGSRPGKTARGRAPSSAGKRVPPDRRR